jgi:rhodanese-related sulfurtransferase
MFVFESPKKPHKNELRKEKTGSMKRIVTLFAAFLLVTSGVFGQSVYVGKASSQGKVLRKYIEPGELKKLVENPVDSIWIIDVRSEKAFQSGHIPAAKSFPAGSIMQRMNEIPREKYLILYCNVGANAQIVSKKLRKAGYRRYINWGGISRWDAPREFDTDSK